MIIDFETCNSFPGALEGHLWPRPSPQWSQFGLCFLSQWAMANYYYFFGAPTKEPSHAGKEAHV